MLARAFPEDVPTLGQRIDTHVVRVHGSWSGIRSKCFSLLAGSVMGEHSSNGNSGGGEEWCRLEAEPSGKFLLVMDRMVQVAVAGPRPAILPAFVRPRNRGPSCRIRTEFFNVHRKELSAAVDAGPSMVLWLSLWANVARRTSTGTVDCCLRARVLNSSVLPVLPADDVT
jgi:hypothetical protein